MKTKIEWLILVLVLVFATLAAFENRILVEGKNENENFILDREPLSRLQSISGRWTQVGGGGG